MAKEVKEKRQRKDRQAKRTEAAKDARDRRIFDLWLACWTNEEIGVEVGCDEKTVRTVIGESAELPKLRKPDQTVAEHADSDFTPPIYNVWTKTKTTEVRKVDAATKKPLRTKVLKGYASHNPEIPSPRSLASRTGSSTKRS